MDVINSYSIVAYLSGPVARFADALRRELVPGCPHHAHITILPPRPLYCRIPEAIEFARQLVVQFDPFDVRLDGVKQFSATQVIYISLVSGVCELTSMHDVLNTGFFGQEEIHEFVPHITLGRELPLGSFDSSLSLSERRWQEFGLPPSLRIETVTFVQQRGDDRWVDLAELALGRVPAVG